ncbi:MAG: ribosomal protein S18-alanine N-acetyltransferase [Thermodesulfobacteriota bacterium]
MTDINGIWAIEKVSFPTPWSRFSFLAELGHSLSHTLVAGPPGPQPWQVWGYLIYWVVAEEMHILNLAVHPQQRRRGLARRLLTASLAQARKLGAQVAWLEVRPSNDPALSLYHSFGFQEVGRRPRYYDDTEEDALLLAFYWEEGEEE